MRITTRAMGRETPARNGTRCYMQATARILSPLHSLPLGARAVHPTGASPSKGSCGCGASRPQLRMPRRATASGHTLQLAAALSTRGSPRRWPGCTSTSRAAAWRAPRCGLRRVRQTRKGRSLQGIPAPRTRQIIRRLLLVPVCCERGLYFNNATARQKLDAPRSRLKRSKPQGSLAHKAVRRHRSRQSSRESRDMGL